MRRLYYFWESSRRLFVEFAKVKYAFAKVSRKVDIMNPYCLKSKYYNVVYDLYISTTRAAQEKGAGEFRFGSGSVPCLMFLDFHFCLHRKQKSFQR